MRGVWKTGRRFGIGTVVLLALGAGPVPAQAPHGSPAPGRWQPPPPPKNWTAPEVKGYTDGVNAAWVDLAGKLDPDPARHLIYKTPPSSVRLDRRYFYRLGFRDGYNLVYAHERGYETQAKAGSQ